MIKRGFTLSEVLITLAVIGVVAAMTIPTLISTYKKRVVETKLQRVYSIMNNAIKLSTIDNGETYTWSGICDRTSTYDNTLVWFNKYLANYLKYSKIEQNGNNLLVYFMDGSILVIKNTIYDMLFYLDAKAFKNPTKGINSFNFRFQPSRISDPSNSLYEVSTKYSVNPGFEPYTYSWDGTVNGAKHDTINNKYGCYDTVTGYSGALCSKLIQLNGWKIPDDYPYKF